MEERCFTFTTAGNEYVTVNAFDQLTFRSPISAYENKLWEEDYTKGEFCAWFQTLPPIGRIVCGYLHTARVDYQCLLRLFSDAFQAKHIPRGRSGDGRNKCAIHQFFTENSGGYNVNVSAWWDSAASTARFRFFALRP